MAFVSITRARIRSLWFFPRFARAALLAVQQAETASGFLGGRLLPDGLRTFWTMTVWRSEEAMRAYMLSGPHRTAMPQFFNWCDEASVVHWEQVEGHPPTWASAFRRMKAEGRPSKLRRPSRRHQAMAFRTPRGIGGASLTPAPPSAENQLSAPLP